MDIFSSSFDPKAVLEGDRVENIPEAGVVCYKTVGEFEDHLLESNPELCAELRLMEQEPSKESSSLPSRRKREERLKTLCVQKVEQSSLVEANCEVKSSSGTLPNRMAEYKVKPSTSAGVRPIFETVKRKVDTRDVLSKMKNVEGPLGKLEEWVRTRRRVRIVLRERAAPNSVITAVIIAFDKHWNIIFRDGDEIFLPPSKISRDITYEDLIKLDNSFKRMNLSKDDHVFRNIGKSRKLYTRHLKCSMIRGENIVLIQQT